MPDQRQYDPKRKQQVFDTLRREILAARLKVTLDEQLGRTTSPTVIRLSKMRLPPIVRTYYSNDYACSDAAETPRTGDGGPTTEE